jgi:hypothetical protein
MVREVTYQIGEKVLAGFCLPSQVVGIDRYTLKAFDGQIRSWFSYTLISSEPGLFARWWIVNVPLHGVYYFVAGADIPHDAVFDPVQSGLVRLESEGDAALSAPKGALAVYRTADGTFYSQEVFDGAERLLFTGKVFHSDRG